MLLSDFYAVAQKNWDDMPKDAKERDRRKYDEIWRRAHGSSSDGETYRAQLDADPWLAELDRQVEAATDPCDSPATFRRHLR